MKRYAILVAMTFCLLVGPSVSAQEAPMADAPDGEPRQARPKLMKALGLSPEQIDQMQTLMRTHRPAMQAAQRRLRQASRDLDQAIYNDAASDAEVETRLKEFLAAQADVSSLRFENEYAVRRVLTPEQLVKFRELRRRFAEDRVMRRQRPDGRQPKFRRGLQGPGDGRNRPPNDQ